MAIRFAILSLAISATFLLSSPVSGQITMPCTPSMITTFSPCLSFVSNNSTLNATTPPPACCDSLKSLMSSGKDCLCFMATGSPFRIPINRTLAMSLPRACNMPGVPLQCQTAGAPAPAPGAVANGPSLSPNSAPSPSVNGLAPPEPLSPTLAPEGDATPAPPATTTTGGAPTGNTGSRAGATPSAAKHSYSVSPMHIMVVLGAVALKYY